MPEQIEIPNQQPPFNLEKQEVSSISEKNDGTILLRFGSFKESSSYHTPISRINSRSSFSSFRSMPRSTSLHFHSPFPTPASPSDSPGSSTMNNYSSINVISKPFVIDKDFLREDFSSPQNSDKRQWFSTFDKTFKDHLRTVWYKDMEKRQITIPFFLWFDLYYTHSGMSDLFNQSAVNVQTNLQKKWQLNNGTIVQSVHPPLTGLQLSVPEGEVQAAPFKNGREGNDKDSVVLEDIKKIYHQNNFSNQILHTISTQIDHISNKIDSIPNPTSKDFPSKIEFLSNSKKTLPSNSKSVSFFNDISKPSFEVDPISPDYLSKPFFSKNPLLHKIDRVLDNSKDIKGKSPQNSFRINCLDKNCQEEQQETDQISKQSSELSSEDEVLALEENFSQPFEIARIRESSKKNFGYNPARNRNYYQRPTPLDIGFEERSQFKTSAFSAEHLYEWNIDGKSEYEILNTLQEIGMLRTVYAKWGMPEPEIAQSIAQGFTGQLRNWWDNYLPFEEKKDIIYHVSEEVHPERDELIHKHDGTKVLIHSIGMYFVGNPSEELQSQNIILTNLRCPTLSDYRWYKDTFLTYVLKRDDCNSAFWKEKFISGLPTLFARKILDKIQEALQTDNIDWSQIAYGHLFAFVKKEGLKLCTEL